MCSFSHMPIQQDYKVIVIKELLKDLYNGDIKLPENFCSMENYNIEVIKTHKYCGKKRKKIDL